MIDVPKLLYEICEDESVYKEDIDLIDSLYGSLGGPVSIVDTGRGIYITQDGKCLIGDKIGLVDDMDDDCD